MPAYDYQCQKCLSVFEVVASLSAKAKGLSPCCQQCGSDDVEQTFLSVNFIGSHSALDSTSNDGGHGCSDHGHSGGQCSNCRGGSCSSCH